MDDLGLKALTDDQIVELVRAIATELSRRRPEIGDAATRAIRDQIERSRATVEDQWTRRKWVAEMVQAATGAPGWTLNVWVGDISEVRVYAETGGEDWRGRGRSKYTLYVTGGNTQPPGQLTRNAGPRAQPVDETMLHAAMLRAAETFPSGVRIDVDQALATAYETPPLPQEFSATDAHRERDNMNTLPANPLAGIVAAAGRGIPQQTGATAAALQIPERADLNIVLADVSRSMADRAGETTKWQIMRDALAQTESQVIAFATRPTEVPRGAPLPQPSGGTALHLALLLVARKMPTSILVISDGHPDDADAALRAADALGPTVRIDIVFCGPDSDSAGLKFMQRLARRGGHVTHINLATEPQKLTQMLALCDRMAPDDGG